MTDQAPTTAAILLAATWRPAAAQRVRAIMANPDGKPIARD